MHPWHLGLDKLGHHIEARLLQQSGAEPLRCPGLPRTARRLLASLEAQAAALPCHDVEVAEARARGVQSSPLGGEHQSRVLRVVHVVVVQLAPEAGRDQLAAGAEQRAALAGKLLGELRLDRGEGMLVLALGLLLQEIHEVEMHLVLRLRRLRGRGLALGAGACGVAGQQSLEPRPEVRVLRVLLIHAQLRHGLLDSLLLPIAGLVQLVQGLVRPPLRPLRGLRGLPGGASDLRERLKIGFIPALQRLQRILQRLRGRPLRRGDVRSEARRHQGGPARLRGRFLAHSPRA
mmetsp:Transcript_19877/g.59565  ORF Transcript_19877/g.59565 Transcript_19877/m.59565 type:complete len:290 (-) Transcript_19877:138-1007(-)